MRRGERWPHCRTPGEAPRREGRGRRGEGLPHLHLGAPSPCSAAPSRLTSSLRLGETQLTPQPLTSCTSVEAGPGSGRWEGHAVTDAGLTGCEGAVLSCAVNVRGHHGALRCVTREITGSLGKLVFLARSPKIILSYSSHDVHKPSCPKTAQSALAPGRQALCPAPLGSSGSPGLSRS